VLDTTSTPNVVVEEAPFLEQAPPHWAARGLAMMLLVLFVAVVVASIVITLPETIASPFVLVPGHGADPIRASRGGVIAAVRVSEGQTVERGTPVFVIRSAAAGDRSAELSSLETQMNGAEDSRLNARQRYEGQRRADEEELRRLNARAAYLRDKLGEQRGLREVREARFKQDIDIQTNDIEITQREIGLKRSQYGVARELSDRLEKFHKEGAISWLEYNNRRLEATRLEVEGQQLERALENSRLKLNQIRSEHQTWEIEWKLGVAGMETEAREVQAALAGLRQTMASRGAEQREADRRLAEDTAKVRIRATSLRAELDQTRGAELTISTPCAGSVLRLAVNAPGAVVQDGDVLAEVACAGEQLQAEVSVTPTGTGRIQPGQEVRLLYDAFPYQRYGIKHGTVRWVSPASVTVRDRQVFRVLVDLDERVIAVRKGEQRPLLAGMGGRANIVVGRRSLIAYAFEPVRVLRETLADRRPPAR
jgi:multidrug efflux pump subunit AcrA (membrane-fusion protein)